MTSPLILSSPGGALAGLLFSSGLLLVVWRLRVLRPRLDSRVAPYLREPPGGSPLLASHTPFPQLEALLRPVLGDLGRFFERLGSSTQSVGRRLVRAGSTRTVEAFRIEQVIWAAAGLGLGLFLAIILAATRHSHPIALIMFVLGTTVTGVLARDYMLTRQVKQREDALSAEFPTVAELLALAVSAGETPLAALERVSGSTSGTLSEELATTLADVRSGIPLPEALSAMATRTGVSTIARFTDGVATAIERGTPLAQVLRSQAEDARDISHQELLELGGKKEIHMMVPVVFLILPITVLFALFPGLRMLSMS